LIGKYHRELIKIGFEDYWINNWLWWARIGDFDYFVRLHFDFDLDRLLERFLKHNWYGKRIEFHFDIEDYTFFKQNFPCITIWRSDVGLMDVFEKDVEKYIFEEFKELKQLFSDIKKNIKNDVFDLPLIYHPSLFVVTERMCPDDFGNFEKQLKTIALDLLRQIENLIEKNENDPKLEINGLIRDYLKKFALIGLIAKKVERMGKFELINIVKQKDGVNELVEILSRRLKRYGYRRKEIEAVVTKIDFQKI